MAFVSPKTSAPKSASTRSIDSLGYYIQAYDSSGQLKTPIPPSVNELGALPKQTCSPQLLSAYQKEFDWAKTTNPYQRIIHLIEFEDNWDGYGAPRFSGSQIRRTLEIYSIVCSYYVSKDLDFWRSKPFVAPASDGSVLFEWSGRNFPDRSLEISIPRDADQPLGCLKSEADLDEESEIADSELGQLLDWLFRKS